MKKRAYATEGALCDAFQAEAESRGWDVYAETHDWDLLMVRRKDGFQVGVEAKLRASLELVEQVLRRVRGCRNRGVGPSSVAVLLPRHNSHVFYVMEEARCYVTVTSPRDISCLDRDDWMRTLPTVRPYELPDFKPAFGGGRPSPLRLSKWRIAALRLHRKIHVAPMLSPEIKALGLNPGTLKKLDYIAAVGRQGRQYLWGPGARIDEIVKGYEGDYVAVTVEPENASVVQETP